jgi:endogenous inhibitor of DNA gyrase (YacG/DUF329 family)
LTSSREWREANPERAAAYNAARRAAYREAHPLVKVKCSECDVEFEAVTSRVVCSRRCKDRRYRRLHPVEYAAKRARKDARRRERAKAG